MLQATRARMVSVGRSKNGIECCKVSLVSGFLFIATLSLSGFSSATQRCSFRVIFRPQHTRPVWSEYGRQLYLNLSKSVWPCNVRSFFVQFSLNVTFHMLFSVFSGLKIAPVSGSLANKDFDLRLKFLHW